MSTAEALPKYGNYIDGAVVPPVSAAIRYLGDYFKYYGGLAAKNSGCGDSADKRGVFTYTKYEPKGVIGIISISIAALLSTALLSTEDRPTPTSGLARVPSIDIRHGG